MKLSVCVILVAIIQFTIFKIGLCENYDMEKLAAIALKQKYPWTNEHSIVIKRIENSFLQSSIYKILITDIEPAQIFIVVLENRDTSYVFPSDDSVNDFNKLIEKCNVVIGEPNLHVYVAALLLLVDYNSKLVEDINAIKYFPAYLKQNGRYTDLIKPLKAKFGKDKESITIQFFSWNNDGYMREWQILSSFNGAILSLTYKEILKIPLKP